MGATGNQRGVSTSKPRKGSPIRAGGAVLSAVQNQLTFQVWAAPILLTIPMTLLALWVERDTGVRNWWIPAVTLIAFFVAALVAFWAAPKVSQRCSARESLPVMGADDGLMDTYDTVVTWLSGGTNPAPIESWVVGGDNEENRVINVGVDQSDLRSSWKLPPKLVLRYQPKQLVFLVSAETLAGMLKGLDGDDAELPASSQDRRFELERIARALHEQMSRYLIAGGHTFRELTVTCVAGPSLDFPESAALLETARRALNSCKGTGSVLAEMTSGTTPASVALYEAATEMEIPTAWWSSPGTPDFANGLFPTGRPVSIVSFKKTS